MIYKISKPVNILLQIFCILNSVFAEDYWFDTIDDIDTKWSSNCTYFSTLDQVPVECLGLENPGNTNRTGLWTKCSEFGFEVSCTVQFIYDPQIYQPWFIQVKSLIYGGKIHIQTNTLLETITRENTNWLDDEFHFHPSEVNNGVVSITLVNEYAGYYMLFLDSLHIVGGPPDPPTTTTEYQSTTQDYDVTTDITTTSKPPIENMTYFLDLEADLGSIWTSDCFYRENLQGLGPCQGPENPENTTNLGFWTECDPDDETVCRVSFKSPPDFQPASFTLDYLVGGANIRVWSTHGGIINLGGNSPEWKNLSMSITGDEMTEVHFDIFNAFPDERSAIIDSISISNFKANPITYFLDTSQDLDLGNWEINCTGYEPRFGSFGPDCLGLNKPEENSNIGYWTQCEDFGVPSECRVTLTYGPGFSPNTITIKSFINSDGARIKISTCDNYEIAIISREDTDWVEDVIDVQDANFGNKIHFDIINDFNGVYAVILDQIRIS